MGSDFEILEEEEILEWGTKTKLKEEKLIFGMYRKGKKKDKEK